MRISRTTLSILTITALAVGGAAPASAAPDSQHPASASSKLPAGDRARIAQRLVDFGVPADLRAGLLDAINHDRVLDAATGSTPTSTDTLVHDGLAYEVSRFADGSFIATALEKPESGSAVRPDDIQGFSRYTGAGVTEYSHCLVISDTPALTLQFRASYYRSARASGIDEISDWDIQAYAGSCAHPGVRHRQGPLRVRDRSGEGPSALLRERRERDRELLPLPRPGGRRLGCAIRVELLTERQARRSTSAPVLRSAASTSCAPCEAR